MSIDKYRRKRKRAEWTDADGTKYQLEEASGKDGVRLLNVSMGAAKNGAKTIDDAGQMLPFFVEAIAVSVVEEDGSRPLNTDEGRAVIAEWPLSVQMALGQVCIDLQGLGAEGKN